MKRVWDVYRFASELDGPDRDNYLLKTLAGDPVVREEVLRLLAEVEDDPSSAASPTEDTPATIGPYRLIKSIGEGGMGTVYLAEQEGPLRRKVALGSFVADCTPARSWRASRSSARRSPCSITRTSHAFSMPAPPSLTDILIS